MNTKPLYLFLLALLVCHTGLFAQKKSKTDLLADKTVLTYNITFEGEDYQFIVKTSKTNTKLVFDYSIKGGSKILSGITSTDKIASLKNENIYIPGFQGQETNGTYFVLPLALQKKILAIYNNFDLSTTITINNDQYILSSGGVDGFSYNGENEEEYYYVNALYCSLTTAEAPNNYGDFVVHYSDTVPVLLMLSYNNKEDSSKNFSMRLVEVKKIP
jgi:hypothetical protein